MKKEEDREASYCKNIVSDRGDRCLFNFLCGRRIFFSVFPFPVCKARLIGDWLENRRSAPNCSVRLFLFFLSCLLRILTFLCIFCVRSANSNGTGDIGPPIYWRTDVDLRQ